MNDAAPSEMELFDSGTFGGLRRRIGPARNSGRTIVRLAFLAVLIGWAPLFLLATLQTTVAYQAGVKALFSDIAVSCRALIAAPLLVFAVQLCLPRLTEIARNFRDSGIVSNRDSARFDHAWSTTLDWCNFVPADIVIVVLAYATIFALIFTVPASEFPAWYAARPGTHGAFSLAGWWHAAVTLPLLLILILGWLWRVILWARFLYLVSRLDLRLVPAHPDRTAGMKFVGYSVQAFAPVALAFGLIVAGSGANRILYHGVQVASLEPVVLTLVAFVLFLFAGPLVVFTPHLLRAWRRGVREYGSIASRLGHNFESKWFSRDKTIDASALDVQDFSSTTDLYQIVSNVYEVHLFPAGLMSLGILVLLTIAPFAAIALMFVPGDVIMKELIALLT